MEEDNLSEATANLPSSCSSELTRSNSDVSSSFSAENFKDSFHHSVNDNCMTWTNEEHNKYLDYLEMSFVRQLHSSMDLLAWCTGQPDGRSSQKQLADFNKSSEQITVPQVDQLLKINSKSEQFCSHTTANDKVDSLRSPLVGCLRQTSKISAASYDLQECHEFHGEGKRLKGKIISSYGPESFSEQNHLRYSCCQNSVGSIREGTDQNFFDENHEESPSIVSRPKRLKTAVGDPSSKDQIVPCSTA